eukprot:CAMPEP_0195285024 /NCGR_PEP_ID=MMETSP0707-20130614/3007_1 /TAXON_ID=33640 /ORGANISM="Asterionellopsis glacialis, Strain CCMP134" /LENGTH=495 /DNA_ID=CAMNT_0040344453 /DNA_START=187 /DNA_END=1674 /DNA_ORIENTATION=-
MDFRPIEVVEPSQEMQLLAGERMIMENEDKEDTNVNNSLAMVTPNKQDGPTTHVVDGEQKPSASPAVTTTPETAVSGTTTDGGTEEENREDSDNQRNNNGDEILLKTFLHADPEDVFFETESWGDGETTPYDESQSDYYSTDDTCNKRSFDNKAQNEIPQNGRGVVTWDDGSSYDGEWKGGRRAGLGSQTYANGRKYVGQWKRNKIHGRGVFTWPNGVMYNGMFRKNQRHGSGLQTYPDGTSFEGEFQYGSFKMGVFTWPDGRVYRGKFNKRGKKEGLGMKVWPNNVDKYEGTWKNDKCHGTGIRTFASGDRYEGEFAAGVYHGRGKYIWKNGKSYDGYWSKGKKHGQGVHTWPTGKKYDGEYINGEKHGYGVMTYKDGSKYCGGWKSGKKAGRGIQTNADGSTFHCGAWDAGNPIGQRKSLGAASAAKKMQSPGEMTTESARKTTTNQVKTKGVSAKPTTPVQQQQQKQILQQDRNILTPLAISTSNEIVTMEI